jgi:hypothetical protein
MRIISGNRAGRGVRGIDRGPMQPALGLVALNLGSEGSVPSATTTSGQSGRPRAQAASCLLMVKPPAASR